MTRNEFRKMAEQEGWNNIVEKLNRIESYSPQQIIRYRFDADASYAQQAFGVELEKNGDTITEVLVTVIPDQDKITVKGMPDDEDAEEYTLLATKLSEIEFDLEFWFKKSESVEAEVFVKLNDEGDDSIFDYFETRLIDLK